MVSPVKMQGVPGGRDVRHYRGAGGLGKKLAPGGRLESGIGELADGEIRYDLDNLYPITGVHTNQDLIRCVKRGVYMGFWVYRGS